MNIIECITEKQIMSTYPVMSQLRPHVSEENYLTLIREMEGQGGTLIAVMDHEKCVGCSFFRRETRLFTGPMVYVDDLVSDENTRSKGIGKMIIDWLTDYCQKNGYKQLVLDSGVGRGQGHKFYFRENYIASAFHFKKEIK